MTNQQWKMIVDEVMGVVQKISESKGREYTRDNEDRLDNFKRHAETLGVDPLLIWAVYFNKHVDSVNVYIRDQQRGTPRLMSEPIEGRIHDSIVYLMLLLGLLRDRPPMPIATINITNDPSIQPYGSATERVFKQQLPK